MVVRRAEPSDRPNLVKAVVELQSYERELHETRLPGEQIADAYTRWMLSSAEDGGLVLVAEDGGKFVGFAAGWSMKKMWRDFGFQPIWIYLGHLHPLKISRQANREPAS